MAFNPDDLDWHLGAYYRSLYPFDLICRWLSYKRPAAEYLSRREFVFIFKDDVHMRYQSVNSVLEFRDILTRRTPYKVDIGAVYSRPPNQRLKYNDFRTEERELVLDIDLTDYDSYRTCCDGANVCPKCWKFMAIAVKVLEQILKTHFGFAHMLWVFSGRRGIHCWVADEKARKLSNYGREAIAKYIKFDKNGPAINKNRVHPVVEHAYRVIMDSAEIEQLVLEQGWLDSADAWQNVLKLCEDVKTRDLLDAELQKLGNAKLRWRNLLLRFDESERKRALDNDTKLPALPNDNAKHFLRIFVLTYVYPKLDEKVTSQLNHLLKSPFSVHPKSGNIAVPVPADQIATLDLTAVPRVDKLSAELAKVKSLKNDGDADDKENLYDLYYRQTALAPYIRTFETFLNGLLACL